MTKKKTLSNHLDSSLPTDNPKTRDPHPTVDRINELALRIRDGDILLPKFQRKFVWKRRQILTLLDSIGRGFPIGSILLWQSKEDLKSRQSIADLEINLLRPDYPVNYLLDGQQRLSTICGAMYWNGTDPNSPWNIVYDLRKEKFLHLDTIGDSPLHQIRVNKLSDPSVYFTQVAAIDTLTASDKEELKTRAKNLFDRFLNHKIATVTLYAMSIKAVAPVFERINSKGTKLTILDLMRAATWSPEFDLVDTIERILTELANKGFGGTDKKVILRILSSAIGGDYSTGGIDALREFNANELNSAAQVTGDAFKRVVDFLTTQIRVPGAKVVPYSNQLTVLADIFRLLPSPTAIQYSKITEWFWRTAVSGYFSGWNTGQMASDHRAVQSFATGEELEIKILVAKPNSDLWTAKTFNIKNAHAKLLAIILAHMQPVDLLTGQRIDMAQSLAWHNAKEFHHFFPQKYLKQHNEKQDRINCLANIIVQTSATNKAISSSAPSVYLTKVEAAAGHQLETWLSSHLISMEAYRAAMLDDFDTFLNLRAQTIHRQILAKANWDS